MYLKHPRWYPLKAFQQDSNAGVITKKGSRRTVESKGAGGFLDWRQCKRRTVNGNKKEVAIVHTDFGQSHEENSKDMTTQSRGER